MKITIEIETEADPSMVLDLAIETAHMLCQDIVDHGYDCGMDENKVSVE